MGSLADGDILDYFFIRMSYARESTTPFLKYARGSLDIRERIVPQFPPVHMIGLPTNVKDIPRSSNLELHISDL